MVLAITNLDGAFILFIINEQNIENIGAVEHCSYTPKYLNPPDDRIGPTLFQHLDEAGILTVFL